MNIDKSNSHLTLWAIFYNWNVYIYMIQRDVSLIYLTRYDVHIYTYNRVGWYTLTFLYGQSVQRQSAMCLKGGK